MRVVGLAPRGPGSCLCDVLPTSCQDFAGHIFVLMLIERKTCAPPVPARRARTIRWEGGQIALSHITRRGDAPRAARNPGWRRDEANTYSKGSCKQYVYYQPKSPHQSTAPPRPPRSAFRLRPPTSQVPEQCSPRDRRPSPPNTPHAPSRAAPEFSELKWLGQISHNCNNAYNAY